MKIKFPFSKKKKKITWADTIKYVYLLYTGDCILTATQMMYVLPTPVLEFKTPYLVTHN